MRATGFVPWITVTLAGFIAWAAHFLAVYGFAATACARGWAGEEILGAPLIPAGIVLATGLAIVAVLVAHAFSSRVYRRTEGSLLFFSRFLTAATATISVFAILLTTAPSLLLNPCA
jgi:hypothetical protein